MSIKEAVKIAQSNNFMGLVCSSRLLVCSDAHISMLVLLPFNSRLMESMLAA